MTNNNELIYVFSRDYMPFKRAQELTKNFNSSKSEYSEEFVVNDYIEDKDKRVICGKVTEEDWNNLSLEQHNFIKLKKLKNK